MKIFVVFSLFLIGCSSELAPLHRADEKSVIPNQYVIELDAKADLSLHLEALSRLAYTFDNKTSLLSKFVIGDYKAYGAKIYSEKLMNALRALEGISFVEESQIYRASQTCNEVEALSWGLARVSSEDKPINFDDYAYSNSIDQSRAIVFVVDTGIDTQHDFFQGRALWGADFIDPKSSPRTDENGHGTHVAGTVMSFGYGIATRATAIAVRVLDKNGSGSTTGVIDGIEWAVEAATTTYSDIVGIINMSLGGSKSTTMNNAVDAASKAGVLVVVAAGNEAADACGRSPASAESAFTVGSTDIADALSSFSNYGTCVDILAPGSSITSTFPGGVATLSGTSMATPHVAGEALMYAGMSSRKLTPEQIKDGMKAQASVNKIKIPSQATGTPNLLLFQGCF